MTRRVSKEEDAIAGAIHVVFYEDPELLPKVQFTGKVTHRQMLTIHGMLMKGFRQYMGEIRRQDTAANEQSEQKEEKEDDEANEDASNQAIPA